MKKYQNLVFLPSSDALRQDLYKLGLDFMLVRIEGKLQFMVVTNQAGLAQDLSMKHDIQSFYISDNRRNLFKIKRDGDVHFSAFYPTKLGQLSKDIDKKGKPFLVVTEDNATYHYIVE